MKQSKVYGLAFSHDGEEGDNCEDGMLKVMWMILRHGQVGQWLFVMSVYIWGRRTGSAPRDWGNTSYASRSRRWTRGPRNPFVTPVKTFPSCWKVRRPTSATIAAREPISQPPKTGLNGGLQGQDPFATGQVWFT